MLLDICRAQSQKRMPLATVALGIASASIDCAAKYALERKAFGAPISKLQMIQDKVSGAGEKRSE